MQRDSWAALATGCKEEYKTYSDAEYVLFADTLATYAVLKHQDYSRYRSPRPSRAITTAHSAWRSSTQGSNAVEGKHYRLLSNTITIKAGSRKADVQVRGLYDNIEDTDSLGFILKLVMPEQLKWDLYHDRTKVVMQKSCPYDIN